MLRPRRRLAAASRSAALATLLTAAAEAVALAQGDAPSPDALAAARALFADALADQEAGRLQAALDKFTRVRAVRDTAPVEYRIGSCQEGLGHPAAAYGAYQSAVTLGAEETSMADVVKAAHGRLDALSRHVARLTLVVPPDAQADLTVDVDADEVPRASWGQPLPVEPGTHTVVASSHGQIAFRGQVALPEGGEASLPLSFAPATPPSAPPPADQPAPAASSSHHTLGFVLLGTGAALVVGSAVALLARHQDITSLNDACPGGRCPLDQQASLESTRDRALVEGPLAAALAIGGAAAAATGLYFVLTPPAPGPAAGATAVGSPGVTFRGTF